MATINITNTTELTNALALATAADGDVLHFAAGDYTSVLIDIADGRGLTFTSDNAGDDPSTWAPGSEVILNRISTLGALVVDGIHVHATAVGAGFVNGGTWEAIGVGSPGHVVTVVNSVLSIHGDSSPSALQGFGLNITYNTDDITVDHVHIGPFTGGFDDSGVSNYGMWINGSNDTGRVITVTNNVFETGSPRAVAVAFDSQVGGSQIDVSGNQFEDPGTAPGSVRVFDFSDTLVGPQDYTGVTGNHLVDGGQSLSNETGNDVINFGGSDDVTGTAGDDTFVADVGNDTIDGLGGSDTIDMVNAGSSGSNVDLQLESASSVATGLDTIISIENVKGSVGNDNLKGTGDANTFIATGGTDAVDGRGGSDTFDASAAATAVAVNLDAVSGAISGAFNGTLKNVENVKTGSGDDSIAGSSSDNAVDGGAGFDTFTSAGTYSESAVTHNGSAFVVAAGAGTDTLTGVEKAVISGQTVWLVDDAAELTTALAGAGSGDIIKLASGTYVGSFTIGTGVTLESVTGDADDVTIMGDFRESNPAMGSANFADWLSAPTTTAYNSGTLQTGLTIAADGVTVRGITIQNFLTGINIGSNDGLTLDNVDIDSTVTGVRKGTAAVVTDLDWIGGNVTNSYHGATFNAAADDSGELSDVLIQGVSFTHLAEKGLYFEQLDDAQLLDLIMNDVGQLGRGPAFGGVGPNAHGFGAGIDINLKYEDYSNIEIANFDFTNVGLSDGGTGTPHGFGGAITVKARDDAPSYGSNPSTLTGVNIHDGTIDGTSTGIRIGEPTKTNAGPADVSVTNVTVLNAVSAEYDNRTGSTLEVNLGDDHNVSSSADATGIVAYTGSSSSDTYTVNEGDTVTEASGGGTDTVNARGSFTLDDNVENLTLLDVGSGSDDFENFSTGLITDGENGWNVDNAPRGEVVDLGGNNVMLISSDPTDGTFGGPYSHDIGVSAGEPSTTADGNVHVISFRVKAVDSTPDNSRMEVDFGNVAGTDRNNFMVIESIAGQGVRIAVADPLLDGHWDTGAGLDDFSAFTGNRTLVSGVDPSDWLNIELRLTYNNGQDNDVIEVYLNGTLIGTTTTFENYRDALGGTHSVNAEANQTSRILFRGSASTATTDGPGGVNKGFYFDDLSSTVTSHANGTGNDGANVINGNAGDNVLSGLAGNDTLNGGDGNDTLDGGADVDALSGGDGDDTINVDLGDTDTMDGGAGSDTLNVSGGAGSDTAQVVFSGGLINTLGGSSSNVETVNLDLDGGTDTLDYTGSAQGVTVDLGAGTASGLSSIANIENVTGGSASDTLTGNGGSNTLLGGGSADDIDGGAGSDTLDGGAGGDTLDGGADTDTALGYGAGFHLEIQAGKWVVTNGTDTDVLTNVEKVTIDGETYILVDSFADGGFGSVQDAIDSASGGETILIAPGDYTEQMQYQGGSQIGLVIDKSVTLQGVDGDGNWITDAGDVEANIISAVQSWWGTNFFVTANNVEIRGLEFTAADGSFYSQGDEVNKAFEIVGNGFKMQFTLVGAADGVNVASTIYINDDTATYPGFVSDITSFLIDQNIFEGAVVVTNGPGVGHPIASIDFKITDNDFVMNPGSDVGYNWGIILNGREATIPWRVASIVLPEITGNTFTSDYAIYLRALDDDPAKTPDRAYVDAFIADNVTGDYAFAAEADGDPQLNASSANRFYIHNALDAAVGDALSGGNVVFRAAADTSYTVNKNGLTFDAQDGSGVITLTLGTANDIDLAGDHDVTVLGNGGTNVINGNDGDNFLGGAGGSDTINGGAGSDTIDAGGGTDTVVFDADYADLTITRIGVTNNYVVTNNVTSETDSVFNVENFTIDGQTVSAASAVTDAAPTIDSVLDSDTSTSTLLVVENTSAGTTVAQVTATDPNGGLDTLAYSLLNTDNSPFTGPFEIDANGAIKVKTGGTLDFEGTNSFTFKVQVTDAHGNTDTETVTINLTDVDEFNVSSPVVDNNVATNTVNENVATGTTVGLTAFASDADGSNNAVTYSLTSNPLGLFAIDTNTGVVTVAAAIDREVHGATQAIEVTATSADGSTSTQTFNIAIGDVDEFNVSTPTDSNGTANAVSEDAAIGTAVGVTASASDADATTNGITYTLSSNPDGLFQINGSTGAVTTAAALNREVHGASRTIEVTATSADGSTSTQTFNIAIGDVDEFNVSTPTDSNAAANTVNENVAIGTAVGVTASASDADATTNAITYSLSSNPDGLFQINASTGVVTTAAALNREVHGASRNIQVTATSADGSTSVQTFTVAIGDVDEFNVSSPVVDNNATANAVNENLTAGALVGITAFASDADATTNAVTYSLSSNPDGLFTINTNTGVVTTAVSLNRETMGTTRAIQVTATSADGSTSVQTFNIAINNANDPGTGQFGDVNVEAGLRQADLGLDAGTDPDGAQTFTVTALPAAGTLLLNGVAVTLNQVLTEAQFEALTYASPQTAQDVQIQFSVSDGVFAPHTELLTITVDPADDATYQGTAVFDELDGGAGNDVINGLGGADLMIGGTGNDTYIVSQGGDVVDEDGGDGIDLVQATVSYNLASALHVKGSVENLRLMGTLSINGTGNGLANVITGNSADNTLIGGAGNDTLNGMQGNDTLTGGANNDVFFFNVSPTAANLDSITDFSNVAGNNDLFNMEGSVFTTLGANGTLNSAFFYAGAAAHDANDHIIYNQATGALFYDSNGNAAGGSFKVATLVTKPTLTFHDFIVV